MRDGTNTYQRDWPPLLIRIMRNRDAGDAWFLEFLGIDVFLFPVVGNAGK